MSTDLPNLLSTLPLWKDARLTITSLPGGMTNDNFLVDDGTKKYVARFAPLKTDILGLRRDYEIYNATVASHNNLTAPVTAYVPEHRLLIIEFIPGTPLTETTAIQDETMKKVARTLKKLHHIPSFQNTRNQFEYTRNYLQLAKKHNGWIPRSFDSYLKQLDALEQKIEPCTQAHPCHLDLVLENIILQPDGEIRFIDWEYSANSDFRYDLAMFLTRINVSETQKRSFLEAYGSPDTDTLFRNVCLFELVVHLAEAGYGMLQTAVATKQSVDYKAYAEGQLASFDKKSALYLV